MDVPGTYPVRPRRRWCVNGQRRVAAYCSFSLTHILLRVAFCTFVLNRWWIYRRARSVLSLGTWLWFRLILLPSTVPSAGNGMLFTGLTTCTHTTLSVTITSCDSRFFCDGKARAAAHARIPTPRASRLPHAQLLEGVFSYPAARCLRTAPRTGVFSSRLSQFCRARALYALRAARAHTTACPKENTCACC